MKLVAGPRDLLGLLAAAAAAAAVFLLLVLPGAREARSHLTWDECQHLLGGMEVHDALAEGGGARLERALLQADLYPPGHSLWLGAWMRAFGDSDASLEAFKLSTLLVAVVGLWLGSLTLERGRRAAFLAAATTVLLVTSPVLALSAMFMVDVPASALALCALALIAALASRATLPRALLALALVAATLLSKYNIGLPLIPAAFVAGAYALARRRRLEAVATLAVALLGLGAMAGFLSVQHTGWQNFLSFATNRATSEGASPLFRLQWYAAYYAEHYVFHAAVALGVVALAAVGTWSRRGPLALAAATYVLGTLATLAFHAYNLDRNIVSVGMVLCCSAGLGAATLFARADGTAPRWRPAALVALCALLLAGSASMTRRYPYRLYKQGLSELPLVSSYVRAMMKRPGRFRVVGTFNEFSLPWTRILWRQAGRDDPRGITTGLPYPLEQQRTGLDPRPAPEYWEEVVRWYEGAPEENLITLEVLEGSPCRTGVFENWGVWKHNYVRALDRLSGLQLTNDRVFEEVGVRLRVYRLHKEQLAFEAGWGPQEPWGRWATEREAVLHVRAPEEAVALALRPSPLAADREPVECVALVDGVERERFTVSDDPGPRPELRLALPEGRGDEPLVVTLRFFGPSARDDGAAAPGAVPFEVVRLTSVL